MPPPGRLPPGCLPRGLTAGVARFIAAHRLLEPGQPVLCAFSGGPDSTALALTLLELDYRVVLGHVDHGWRASSGLDAEHCRSVASELGLAVEVVRLPVPPAGEAAAREARYRALHDMARTRGVTAIATGHTLDDDAETVLLRLHRGGTPLGIPPRRGRVVRPLLGVRRDQTAALCQRVGVAVLTDPSNADERYARNHLRHRVLPGFGSEGVEALAALGDETRAARRHLEALVDAAWAGCARSVTSRRHRGRQVRLDRRVLAGLPPRVAAGVLRRGLSGLVAPDLVSSRLVADLAGRALSRTGAQLDLPGGWVAWSEPDALVLGLPEPDAARPPVALRCPGRTPLPEWGLSVLVEVVALPTPLDLASLGAAGLGPASPQEAVLDAQAAQGPLQVRPRRPGDRYRPLGSPGSRKLQDVLVDLKVPRRERGQVPVLCCAGRIAWVVGHRIDHAFRLTPASRSALRIRVMDGGEDAD